MTPTAMGSFARLQISIRSNERVAFFISAIARSGIVLNREKGFLISLLIGKYSCHTASSSETSRRAPIEFSRSPMRCKDSSETFRAIVTLFSKSATNVGLQKAWPCNYCTYVFSAATAFCAFM